jgi:transcriptional regulator with XRE-family HTH domain
MPSLKRLNRKRFGMKKIPNPVDRHVGSRVRLRRVLLGMSQERLGEALSLTFQQVQKYEKGTNRIGASRLNQISKILGMPVSFFFEGAPPDSSLAAHDMYAEGFADQDQSSYDSDIMSSADGLQLAKAFLRIRDPKRRRMVISLANSLADEDSSESKGQRNPN